MSSDQGFGGINLSNFQGPLLKEYNYKKKQFKYKSKYSEWEKKSQQTENVRDFTYHKYHKFLISFFKDFVTFSTERIES